jgi:calcineurin-like phosphoesterase family protein
MPENIFFISDTHFNHAKIMEYEKRLFKTVEEMNEYMIKVWNDTIKKSDRVYHLGDFSFHDQSRIAQRLNGRKFLIIGNHDYVNKETSNLFEWVGSYKKIKVNDQVIVMCHYPFKEWEMKQFGSWNLFGHCHGNLQVPVDSLQLDVGVDSIGYVPKEFSEIKQIFENKKI